MCHFNISEIETLLTKRQILILTRLLTTGAIQCINTLSSKCLVSVKNVLMQTSILE